MNRLLAARRGPAGPAVALLATFLSLTPSRAEVPPAWGYLDNGMGYVLIENHAAPLVGSTVVVSSGSSREDFATSGASHFLEHLLFNGTESRTQEQLYDEVDALGGYDNATTRKTHVVYIMVVPSENARKGLEIQRDMLFHSTLPADKVEKERGIILEELAKDQDSGDFDVDRMMDLSLYGTQGAGLPTLGSPQSIRSLSRDTIAAFYHRFYTPQNMTLVVVGDFSSSDMEREIRETFGAEPAGPPPPEFHMTDPTWGAAPTVGRYRGESVVVEGVWPGPDPRSPSFLASECIAALLVGEDSSPWNQALRDRYPGKIRSSTGSFEMFPDRTFFRYRIEADPSVDGRALAAAIPGLFDSRRVLPGTEEIDAWKVSRETEEYYLRERPHYYGIMRGDRIAAQGIAGLLGLRERLAALSPADLAGALRTLASGPSRWTIALPEPPVAETTSAASPTEARRDTLGNGTALVVLSSPESPVLAIHAFIRGRSQCEPAGMDGATELLHRLLALRTTRSDPATLSRRLRAIGAELKTADDPTIPYDDFYSVPEFSFIRLQSLDRYAAEAFALLGEMLASPAWTDADFTEAQQSMIGYAERAAMGSSSTARSLVRSTLYPGQPQSRAVFGTPATLKAITPDALRAYAKRYLVARRFLVVIATSLPAEEIEKLAQAGLGNIPAGEPPAAPVERVGISGTIRSALAGSDALPSDLSTLSLPDSTVLRVRKVGAKQATLTWVQPLGRIRAEDLPALDVWNATVSSAIQFQLREREGLAYSLGSSVDRLDDGMLLWVASAGTAAKNLPRVMRGFREGLQSGLAAAPDSAAVHREAAQLYGRTLMRRATRMNRAWAAGLAVLAGRDPAGIDEEMRSPLRATAEAIRGRLADLRPSGPGVVAIVY